MQANSHRGQYNIQYIGIACHLGVRQSYPRCLRPTIPGQNIPPNTNFIKVKLSSVIACDIISLVRRNFVLGGGSLIPFKEYLKKNSPWRDIYPHHLPRHAAYYNYFDHCDSFIKNSICFYKVKKIPFLYILKEKLFGFCIGKRMKKLSI